MKKLLLVLLLCATTAQAEWPLLSGKGTFATMWLVPNPLTPTEAAQPKWVQFWRVGVKSAYERYPTDVAACGGTPACKAKALADLRGRVRYHASVYYGVANTDAAVSAAIAADTAAKAQ